MITLCLNGPPSSVDFMDVIMGDIPGLPSVAYLSVRLCPTLTCAAGHGKALQARGPL